MISEQELQKFIDKKSDKEKIIVIYWPTGSGKTWGSISIAQQLKTEIISTDSRQIYKDMNIGTGKVTEAEMDGVTHHMLDIISPDEKYWVWEFKNISEELIQDLHGKWKISILCGGTWLYIDSLIFDFDIPKVIADNELRARLEQEALEKWNQYVYDKLIEIDPEYAKELHPNNLQYVIRAIEVKMVSGKSKRDFRTEKKLKYDTLFLTPYAGDREYLYNRINLRVQMMFDEWLVEEVENLRLIYSDDTPGLQTIWYIEVVDYLKWNTTLEECIALVQQHNRNYAKRQLTWFGKYKKYF